MNIFPPLSNLLMDLGPEGQPSSYGNSKHLAMKCLQEIPFSNLAFSPLMSIKIVLLFYEFQIIFSPPS